MRWNDCFPRTKEFDSERRLGKKIIKRLETDVSPYTTWALGDLSPRHLIFRNDYLVYVDFELARRRPDLYDVVYFCHRSLTRGELKPWGFAVKKARMLIRSFVERISSDKATRKLLMKQILALFGLRVLGGFNDLYSFKIGDSPQLHIQALRLWKSSYESRTALGLLPRYSTLC